MNELIDPVLTIFDLDKDYYKKLQPKFQKMLNYCNSRCYANCFYEVSWIRKHPFKFARNFGFKQFSHYLDEYYDPELRQHKEQAKINLKNKYQHHSN